MNCIFYIYVILYIRLHTALYIMCIYMLFLFIQLKVAENYSLTFPFSFLLIKNIIPLGEKKVHKVNQCKESQNVNLPFHL